MDCDTGIRELAPIAQPLQIVAEIEAGSLAQLYRIRWVRQPDATRSRRIENGSRILLGCHRS
jgi:hypothetical protein